MNVLTDMQTTEWEKTAVAMGKFEGLHAGHKKLIDKIMEKQQEGFVPVAFTFDVSPRIFFGQEEGVLFTPDERRRIFSSWQVEHLLEYPFTGELAKMEAEAFIEEILHKKLRTAYLVVGNDFHFGYRRRGDVNMLQQYAQKGYFELEVIEKVADEQEPISSTRIRQELKNGNMELVSEMLKFHFFLEGNVVFGNRLGRTWGFPTANIIVDSKKLLPPDGVYYSRVKVDEKLYYGITNIGTKPTVANNGNKGAETFLYDFDGELYGKDLKVELLHYVRKEQAFESIEMLIKQIQKDVNSGREYFNLKSR